MDRQRQWEESPTIPVVEPTSNKTAYLLSKIGREVAVYHHGGRRRVTPVAIFHKPAYGRTYVQVKIDGAEQPTAWNLSDVTLPREAIVRLARSNFEFAPSATPVLLGTALLGLLLLIAVVGVGVFLWRGNGERLHAQDLTPRIATAGESAAVTTTASQPPMVEYAITAPAQNARPDPPVSPTEEPATAPSAIPPATASSSDEPVASLSDDPPADFGRVFTSRIGTTLRAEFVKFEYAGRRATLLRADGYTLDVALSDLSKRDQQWIRDELKRRKAAHQEAP